MAKYVMDPSHKQLLQQRRMYLLDMEVGDRFLAYLRQGDDKTPPILSREMEENIKAERTPTRQTSLFLDTIARRGPRAFLEFYKALLVSDQQHFAELLKPGLDDISIEKAEAEIAFVRSRAPPIGTCKIQSATTFKSQQPSASGDIPGSAELAIVSAHNPYAQIDDLPEVWPVPDLSPLSVEVQPVGEPFRDAARKAMAGDNSHYEMVTSPRGRAIIINNEDFFGVNKLRDRKGSGMDCTSLSILFKQLKYEVVLRGWKNLTASEIRTQLNAERKHSHHANYCSFILVIMSHGTINNSIYGVDGETITMKEIMDMFDGKSCPDLAGKPKVFIVQACQGRDKDTGAMHMSPSYGNDLTDVDSGRRVREPCESIDPSSLNQPSEKTDVPDTPDGNSEAMEGVWPPEHVDARITDSFAITPTKVAVKGDTILANAATEGMASWRVESQGSWYIQAVVYIFSHYAHNFEIKKLFDMVNQLLSKQATRTTKEEYRQTSSYYTELKKDMFFYPGL